MKTYIFVCVSFLLTCAICWGEEFMTTLQDPAQLETILTLVAEQAPKEKIFRITETLVLPTAHQYLAQVWYDKQPITQHRYTYKCIQLVRPSDYSKQFDAKHPFAYSFEQQSETPDSEVYVNPKTQQEIYVPKTVTDQAVERIIDFIEKTGEFRYKPVGGKQKKILTASEILSQEMSIGLEKEEDILDIYPSGKSLFIRIKVSPEKIKFLEVKSFVI